MKNYTDLPWDPNSRCVLTVDDMNLTPYELLPYENCAIDLYFMAVTKL